MSVASSLKITGLSPSLQLHIAIPGFVYPVRVVEQLPPRPHVRKGEDVLVHRLPGLVAQALRLGVVGVEDLAGFQHRAYGQPGHAVFRGEIFVERGLEHGDPDFVHASVIGLGG